MKEINWAKWSAVAEILSSAAIVITLGYLALQTQQNSAALLASTRHQMLSADLQINSDAISNPSISVAMWKKDLTTEEKVQLQYWLIALVRSREHQWFQFRDGLLDERLWRSYSSGLSATLSTPRTRAWWENVRYEWFDHEFADVVSDSLANVPISNEGESRYRFEMTDDDQKD
jgi:hypothetical protein